MLQGTAERGRFCNSTHEAVLHAAILQTGENERSGQAIYLGIFEESGGNAMKDVELGSEF